MRRWLAKWAYALIPSGFTLIITLWGLTRVPLWLDELVTLDAVTEGPFAYTHDMMHVPWYVFMWVWTFGGSVVADSWLRLPSALFMTLATFFVAVTAKEVGGRRSGLAAGIVFALVPGVSRFGQETRSTALVTALAAGATLILVLGARNPSRRRLWVGYVGLLAPMGLLNSVSLALVAGHAVLAWRYFVHRRPQG